MRGWCAPLSLTLIVVLASERADACSGCPEGNIVYPREGDVVPTNARFHCRGEFCEIDRELVDANGVVVDGTWSRVVPLNDLRGMSFFTPARELDPASTYEWRTGGSGGSGGSGYTFTTADGPMTTSPAIPTASIVTAWSAENTERDTCENNDFRVRIELAIARDPSTMLLIDRDGTATLDVDALEGELDVATTLDSPTYDFGTHYCAFFFPGRPGATGALRFAALDMAGNFSGWSEPLVVEVPPPIVISEVDEDHGCASMQSFTVAFFALVLFALPIRRS